MGCTSDFERTACAIGVMAKAPRPGFSKTRLCPPLDPVQAAALSAAFLHDITENIALAGRQMAIAGYVAYAPAGQETLFGGHLASGTGLLLADGSPPMPPDVQGFGRCLLHAVLAMLARGHGSAVVLNSDSPTLPTSLLVRTAVLLAADGDRVVLGPANDGGYYLLGMKAAHTHLFADIAWSTDTVAETTRRRARDLGLEVVELPTWYDVDDAAGLNRLVDETAAGAGASFSPTGPAVSVTINTTLAGVARTSPVVSWPGHDTFRKTLPAPLKLAPIVTELAMTAGETATQYPYPAPFTARALARIGLHAPGLDIAAE